MPNDVVAAITAQNSEVAAGEVGGLPAPEGQMLNATVTAQSRMQPVEQFENIVLKTLPDGATVRIKDIARVEVGAENYSTIVRINGHPGSGMSISLSPGADALETADRVKARMTELGADFPDGLTYSFTLRPDLKWSDGTPVLASDCVASLKRWAKRNAMGQHMTEAMGGDDGFEVVDDHTFKIKLKTQFGLVLDALAGAEAPAFMFPARIANGPIDQQISLRPAMLLQQIIPEPIRSRLQHCERMHIRLLLRRVRAPRREGNLHVVTALLRSRHNRFIRFAARHSRRQRLAVRMRNQHRLRRRRNRIKRCLFAAVGHVDRHSELVHPCDHRPPEVREPGIRRLASRPRLRGRE